MVTTRHRDRVGLGEDSPMPPKCRILLVDDHAPIREALRSLLSFHDDLQIIGEAVDGKAAIEIIEECQPDVILCDSDGYKNAKNEWGRSF